MTLISFDLLESGPVQLCFQGPDSTLHREVRVPGAALSDLPQNARTAISAHWTAARVAAYEARQAAWEAEIAQQLAPTPETFSRAVQAHLDARAQERSYDGALSIATYVNSENPVWAAEAQAFVAWRDIVWAYALGELAKVEAGERDVPTVEAFVAELPGFEWAA